MRAHRHVSGLSLTIALLLSACGLGRTVLHVEVPSAKSASTPEAVPVKVQAIRDARVFDPRPRQANLPSLNASDVTNPSLTARAVGRKRGTFGKARGDYVLPVALDVVALTRSCLAAALAKSGAVLVDEKDPRFARAVALEVSIDRFWSWLRPGAWAVATEFDAELNVKGALPGFEQGRTIASHSELRKMAINDERWAGVVNAGLGVLVDNLAQALSPALAAVATAPVGPTTSPTSPAR